MFVDMLAVQRQRTSSSGVGFDMSSVETGLMGGATCPQELCKDIVGKFNMKKFVVRGG